MECALSRGKRFLMDKSIPKMVGVSMGNSYYTEKRIYNTLKHFSQHTESLYCFFPDKINIHNFTAAGCSETKSNRMVRQLTNKCNRWIDNSISKLNNDNINIKVSRINWTSELESNQFYLESLNFIKQLYMNNTSFADSINSCSYQAVLGYRKSYTKQDRNTDTTVTQSELNEASNYLLKEFAYVRVAPQILDTPNLLIIYHKDWPEMQHLIDGVYTQQRLPNIGLWIQAIGL